MLNEELIKNYRYSLEQKYNAVCFDIDGTLTETNSDKIDEKAIEMIANLLKRKIPVVFITGRGETGLNNLKNQIYDKLKNHFQVNNNDLHRIYVLTNDGARLFYTNKDEINSILSYNIYLSSKEALQELSNINDNIIKYLDTNSLNDVCNITYSKDLKDETIINIRIVFKTTNERIINYIFKTVEDTIKNNNYSSLYITRGVFENKIVLQIGTAKKSQAIEQAEMIIGVPQNSMLRIGDCGDSIGNDYSMLNCSQGYSVGKTSGDINSCFPVIDKNGNILTGVMATLYLIANAKILPTVCLENASRSKYTYQYALIEQRIIKGRNSFLRKYNEIINKNFDLSNGINELFDEFSGSIRIPMYEWEITENNALKDLFSHQLNGNLTYAIRDNNSYLLRGSKTYYYFLANRQSINGKDITTYDDVTNWYNNCLEFIANALIAINNTTDINSNINKKFSLGILDNLRNILLILINNRLNNEYLNQNILLNLNSKENINIYNMTHILYFVDEIMFKLCFRNESKLIKEEIYQALHDAKQVITNEFICFSKQTIHNDYSKDYRAYREIDNFAENYIATKLSSEANNKNISYNVCGMCYGGLELPIISKLVDQNVKDYLILKFNKQVSGYSNKQLVELRRFNINNYGGLRIIGNINKNDVVLLDDNILTGKTMQLALNTLYDKNIDVSGINIVRYPSINRINQMFMNDHGAVEYNLFFDYINGLCFPCPYSWRDDNELDPYLDSLGVFDINRRKIIECLIKNHDYSELSEVAENKRRIVK